MLYMVIEHFKDGAAVYERFRERGRMAPAGLEYIASWVEPDLNRCFQVMECVEPALLHEWAAHWSDLVDFEFLPVVTGQEMAARLAP
jgi:hypothetical protein